MKDRLCGALVIAQVAACAALAQTGISPAITPPVIAISPRTLDFGSVPIGTTQELSFTVRNPGAGSLSCTAKVSAPFRIAGDSTFILTNAETRVITVQCSPKAMGIYASVVRLAGARGSAVTVTGSGAPRMPSRPAAPAAPRNLRLIAAR